METKIRTITAEEAVRETLGKTYPRMNEDTAFIAGIVNLLENPVAASMIDENGTSHAASEIRDRLWRRYSDGNTSAKATSELLHSIGRENELGWSF